MNKIKETLYQYRLLVVVVCLCIGLSAAYLIYDSFKNKEATFITHVKDDTTIIEGEDITITKDELYQYFLANDGLNLTLDAAINDIASKEITDQDAIDAKVNESVEEYKSYVDGDLEGYAKENGYESYEAFIEEVLVPDAKIQLLQDKYATEHFDDLIKEYKVKYIKTMTFDTESQAMKMIKEVKDEEAFNNAMEANNGSDYGMVTTESSTLDANIIDALDKFKKDGIYSKAIKTSDAKYAIVYVYNSDLDKIKDEVVAKLKNVSTFNQDCETYYLKEYSFSVDEPIIKDNISAISEDYFG